MLRRLPSILSILATCIGLARQRQWPLLTLGTCAIAAAIADYTFWKIQILEPYQPLIQKSAFALLFLWVLATALMVLRIPRDQVLRPTSPAIV